MPVIAWSRTRAIEKSDRGRRRLILAAEVLLVGVAIWLVGPRLAAFRLAKPVSAAMLLVAFFWMAAFAVELGVFFAVSWDDFRDLLIASLRASAPAMWFAPAILLLTMPSRSAMVTGLLLVANTTRLLLSRRAPQKLAPTPPPAWAKRYQLFRPAIHDVSFTRERLPPILGALAWQTGMCAIWLGYPMLAATLIACGAALWTWWSIAKGAMRRKDSGTSHWLIGILLTLLITTYLSVAQLQLQAQMQSDRDRAAVKDQPSDQELRETIERIWQQLEHAPADPPQASKPAPARLATPRPRLAQKEIGIPGSYLAPGVILRNEAKPQRQLLVIFPGAHGRSMSGKLDRPLTIPFTGEYQMFPTSSARLKHDWAMESGSLLDHLYATAGGGSLETEAYQKFDPAMDFSNCGKIQISLMSQEEAPFGASLELVTGAAVVDLGSNICGLDRRSEETLEFTVPSEISGLVQALRVAFHRIPKQGKQSMQVVIRSFTLEPRGR